MPMDGDRIVTAAVRQIDHLYTALDDAPGAFSYLTEVLHLPEAWPLAEYGLFASGGVCLGNVNLEVLKANDMMPSQRAQRPARVTGIAFEPAGEIDAAIASLEARGIAHTPAMPFVVPGGISPAWTIVGFEVTEVTEGTFICKYHFNIGARRQLLADQLSERHGGLLEIVSVSEIVVGARDLDECVRKWSHLLGPPAEDLVWRVGDGPAVRVTPSEADRVEHLGVRVSS